MEKKQEKMILHFDTIFHPIKLLSIRFKASLVGRATSTRVFSSKRRSMSCLWWLLSLSLPFHSLVSSHRKCSEIDSQSGSTREAQVIDSPIRGCSPYPWSCAAHPALTRCSYTFIHHLRDPFKKKRKKECVCDVPPLGWVGWCDWLVCSVVLSSSFLDYSLSCQQVNTCLDFLLFFYYF